MMRYSIRFFVPLAAVVLGFSGVAQAKTVHLSGTFVTESMAKTTPTGGVKATLDTATDELSYTVTYGGLTGPVHAAHFHGPAAAGQEAGVLVPIPGPYASGLHHEVKVTPKVAKDLLAGMTYVNLHTASYPMGEARAQMMVAK
jgi:hypothetical protein